MEAIFYAEITLLSLGMMGDLILLQRGDETGLVDFPGEVCPLRSRWRLAEEKGKARGEEGGKLELVCKK